jgi:hypothetical protein
MGIALLVIGGIWALLGLANVAGMLSNTDVGTGIQAFGLVFNMVLFILPGLVVAGIGEMLRRRRIAKTHDGGIADVDRFPCPYCGERIALRATVCRFCQRTVGASPDST